MSEPPLPPPPPPRREPPANGGWGAPTPYGAPRSGERADDLAPAGPAPTGAPASPPSGPGTPWKAARARRPVRVWDLVLTIVLLLGTFCLTALLSYFGLFLAMASDACGGTTDRCDTDLIGWGVLVAAGGVWLPFLAAVVTSIVLLVVRRIAFWVPIAGMLLSAGFTFVGGWMATVGSGS